MSARRLLAGLLVLLIPTPAFADGISPVLNLFHKDTWLPATVVTLVIIAVESVLLRWRIKEVPYLSALWRSGVINMASSTVGSVLLLGLGRDSFIIWDTTALVLPLFVITVLTESPLIYLLYRQVPINWKRAFALGVGINAASYAMVFVVEIAFAIGWLGYADHADQKELIEWKHPELLARSSGLIYATGTTGSNYGLRVFSLRNARWDSLTNCPAIYPQAWDVAGRTCAYLLSSPVGSRSQTIAIASIPDFGIVREINLDSLVETPKDDTSGWQGVEDLSLSPDAKKIAILFRVSDAVAYKDESSYYTLGGKCRLVVYSVETGQEIVGAARWASDNGLCWFPDSDAVLFSSFRDESLYKTTQAGVRGHVGYGLGYAKGNKFKRALFSCNLKTGGVVYFADGDQPELSPVSRQFSVRDQDIVRIIDLQGKERLRLQIARLTHLPVVLSPDGKLALMDFRRNDPLRPGGRLCVVDLQNPSLSHVLADDLVYRYKWISGP